jgi:hypothetical protein
MSITVEVDLPEKLLKEAQASGLLKPAEIGDLVADELRRRKAAGGLDQTLKQIRQQPSEPVLMDEIVAEVKTVRKERRAGEAGR